MDARQSLLLRTSTVTVTIYMYSNGFKYTIVFRLVKMINVGLIAPILQMGLKGFELPGAT